MELSIIFKKMKNGSYNTSTSTYNKSFVFSGTQLTVSWNYTSYSYASNGVFSTTSGDKGVLNLKHLFVVTIRG